MGLFGYLFCVKQRKEFYNKKQELYKTIRDKNAELESLVKEHRDLKQKFKKLKSLITRYSSDSTYSFQKTDKDVDVVVLVTEVNNMKFDIRVFNEADFSHWKIWLQSSRVNENDIYIWDIQGGDSKGHGSLLLQTLLKLAKEKKITKITGKLAYIDLKSHKEKLIHFYKKNGASVEIFIDKDGLEDGRIYWELD